MALPKLPTIEQVFADPSIIKKLPYPFQVRILEQLQSLEQKITGATNVAATPIEMAMQDPKHQWMNARHLHYLGDQIASAVARSKDNGEQAALMVTMPPRHAKSHSCSVWTPFWFLARYPEDHVMIVTAEGDNARKWGGKVRRLVELHGEKYNLRLNPKKVAADDWELMSGGGMKSFGAGGTIAGNPAKLLIGDDLIKGDEEARSAYQRDKWWDWYEGTFMQRIEPDTTTILIGTRYHEDDILGRILTHSANGDGIHFDLISLAAKAIDEYDPINRAPGEGLWLEHFKQEFYDKREAHVSDYVWSSVYQQSPTAEGGNMVDPDWWGWYLPTQLPQQFDQGCQSWDISLDAQKKTDSQHAGLVLQRQGAVVYIRDGFAEHCDINTVITTLRSWSRIHPQARAKLIERATAGVTLTQTLRTSVPGVMAWPPKGKQKGSKEACLDAIIPAIRSGNVMLPLNHNGTKPKWAVELVKQCAQFPRGQYDDLVDAVSQGVSYLLPGTRSFVDAQHSEALEQREDLTPSQQHTAMLHSLIKTFSAPRLEALIQHTRDQDRSVLPFRQFRTTPSTGTNGRGGGSGPGYGSL